MARRHTVTLVEEGLRIPEDAFDFEGFQKWEPEVMPGKLQNGLPFVDVLVSLHALLSGAYSPEEQERRLYEQIAPLLEVLSDIRSDPAADAFRTA